MDRKRNIGNTNRPQRRQNLRRNRLTRRTRRQAPRPNRNRLSRAQNNINRNRLGLNRRRRYNNFRTRRNPNYRIIFVANLPFNVDNRLLRDLFRREGRITQSKIVYGNNGSKGYGFIEFYNPRDAWRSIQRWNNTMLGGRKIVVQYRKRRRFNNRGFNNNYQRYNQQRGGFGYRRGNRGGFRPRGNRY